MKNHPYYTLLGATLIGLAGVAATGAQAADIGAPVLEDWHTRSVAAHQSMNTRAEPALPSLKDLDAAPRGAMGPIRTGDFSDRTAKADSESVRSDLQMQRFPMANGASIP